MELWKYACRRIEDNVIQKKISIYSSYILRIGKNEIFRKIDVYTESISCPDKLNPIKHV